jgi:hypothetical protein
MGIEPEPLYHTGDRVRCLVSTATLPMWPTSPEAARS